MKSTIHLLTFCVVLILGLQAGAQSFTIVSKSESVSVILDPSDAEVVRIAAKAFSEDVERITGVRPNLSMQQEPGAPEAIIVGTLGKSSIINHLVAENKISKELLDGKWETFLIQVIDAPLPGMKKALVIVGSDPRGTAFGIFELSKRLGVSPWVWWGDVTPAKQKDLSISLDQVVMGPPSVKFRGIFLNDEDWGLKPWAAKNMDTTIRDIGPKTYAQIFELMLRLKANFIWPAMHPCTKAFFYYEDNPLVAVQYDIIVGASHCEPMLRNNVDEWKNNFTEEYGKKPGPWRYDTNEKEINRYWNDRVKEAADKKIKAVYTVGMRGIHDGNMPGPKETDKKIELMNEVIKDQRSMLADHFKTDASEIPQIFCPYKEVLHLYQNGVELPDDVTLVWADDNHGYIRKLSTPEEQARSGRSGVYYHLSYWGKPEDFLWLSSLSPSLISYEMTKAHAYGADRLWVFNVGDIKPAELETEFAMDLAWDVSAWPPEKAFSYVHSWAERTFGKEYAAEIAAIKAEYYHLAASGKPEHLDRIFSKLKFSSKEIEVRLSAYREVARKATALKEKIPERLQDAYFQLVLYPAVCAAAINEKYYYTAIGDLKEAQDSFNRIETLTKIYNKEIAKGKWDGIMSMNPRNRPVFRMPNAEKAKKYKPSDLQKEPLKTISVTDLKFDSKQLQIIRGLGVNENSLSRTTFNAPSYEEINMDQAPRASINLDLPAGQRRIKLVCLPTFAVHEGRALRTAISLGNSQIQIVDVNTHAKSKDWEKNVIRGYSTVEAQFNLEKAGEVTLQLALLDPGLAISSVIVY